MALFLAGFGGWIAFSLVNTGETYSFAGVIVAGLIAYGGTLFALRVSTAHDLRPTYRPNAHVYDSLRTTTPLPRIQPGRLMTAPSGPPRYDVDVAAGD